MLCPANTPLNQIATVRPRVIEIFRDALAFMLRQVDSGTGTSSCPALPCPVCTPDVTWHMPYVTCHIILEVLFSSLIKISHPFLLTSLTFSYLLCSRNLYSLTFLHFFYLVSPSSLLLSSLVLSSLFAACLQPRSPATLSRTEQLSNTQKPW
jgi:hypothetical protein